MTTPNWTLVIHGGAGSMSRTNLSAQDDAAARAGLSNALDAGEAILAAGGSALDAVEAAVRVLEDDPAFNAGRGSVFTFEGAIELDAAVMDGATRDAGAVTGVTRTRNPVSLARAVMEKSPHVLLSREGADGFSVEQQLGQVDPEWFAIPERRRQLEEMKARKSGAFDIDMKYGTVGAVALDVHGHVAAATSTGGLTGKRWGRIGDSPIIGAGTYADDRSCAVSSTGAGEFFIRAGAAHEICARVRMLGETLEQAGQAVFAEIKAMGGVGGVIITGPSGESAWIFNTPAMYRGKASGSGERRVAIYGDE
ncbi:isoaspartyl peptidase/L-asparaginase family protein [Sphingobium phenoxybenzoativorans]|uniref:isoaspartyl peptidase/L-asparaginase family protein n=1 Tax=Sphingobium phenoxybenzoativorans TaxID=1592790 RepID=UPI0008728196|nr:isoaspartyl peptidase/L-asparaginase [Sphingobium phenoxybenzoativorans]